jgi:hypothetical protein
MINQLNGITDATTGAVMDGINNAIGSLNSVVSVLVGRLQGLISSDRICLQLA